MYFYLLFLLVANVFSFEMPETWINPADILNSPNFEDIKQTDTPPPKPTLNTDSTSSSSSKCENFTCPEPPPSVCDSYLKRIVNLLLNEVNLKNYRLPKGDFRNLPLTLHFTSGNLEILHQLALAEKQEDIPWSDFDDAFSSLFEASDHVKESNSETVVISPQQNNYVYFIFIGIVGSLVVIAIWLLLTGGSIFKIIFSFSLLNFAFALVWNLIRAYNMEKEKIREMYHNRFKESQPSETWSGFFEPFTRLMSPSSGTGNELPFLPEHDPLVNVNYGKVFVETIGTIFELLPILGEKGGEMVKNYSDSQNWLMRWIILPITFGLNPILLVIGFLLWAIIREGISFRFPLASFSIGNRGRDSNSQTNQQRLPPAPSQPQIQFQPNQAIEQQSASGIAQYQRSSSIQYEHIPGPSHGNPSIKRVITEYHDSQIITSEPDVRINSGKIRDTSGRIQSIVVTRKGPWQGSVVRYGQIRKRISTVKHN